MLSKESTTTKKGSSTTGKELAFLARAARVIGIRRPKGIDIIPLVEGIYQNLPVSKTIPKTNFSEEACSIESISENPRVAKMYANSFSEGAWVWVGRTTNSVSAKLRFRCRKDNHFFDLSMNWGRFSMDNIRSGFSASVGPAFPIASSTSLNFFSRGLGSSGSLNFAIIGSVVM